MRDTRSSSILAAVCAAAVACAHSDDAPTPPSGTPRPPSSATAAARELHALIPSPGGALAPAQSVISGAGVDGVALTDTESCAGCHADTTAQWRTSAHAFGSFNNPAYRIVVDKFRSEVGSEKSRFCAGCHDVALLVDGAMSAPAAISPADPRAHGGVTCRVCHGIEEARADGNGSYTLSAAPVPIPRDGDAESLRLHKERMALAPLRTAEMCGSCHRSFLTEATGNVAHLVGMDELSAWSQSPFAGSHAARIDATLPARTCGDCHMPYEDAVLGDAAGGPRVGARVRSHRFLGGHTWLAAMRGDAAQLGRARAMLRGAASIDIAAAVHQDGTRSLPADGAPVRPGEALTFDVVVRNTRVGHRFPGGTLDAQDVWIEVMVHDARGLLLAEAGTRQEGDGDDLTAHRLRSAQAGDDGRPLLLRETNHFRATVFNHTIAPRDAEVSRYRFEAPRTLAEGDLPLRVTARLRHRTRNLAIARATCADAKTSRGAAFAAEVKRRTGSTLDACAPQPVTEVAETESFVGKGSERKPRSSAREWQRMYDHALGLLHAVQEQVDDARPSLERARAIANDDDDDGERAMVASLFAQIAARQGRTGEVERWLAEAALLAPGHPAIAHTRGEALAQVWRWRDSLAPLGEATRGAPRDDRAWMHLAVACGSAGDPGGALFASRAGLTLVPRDADMLRVQALALETLGAPPDEVERAKSAFLAFRTPDDAPRIRAACSKNVPGCALERIPVHVHVMRAAR